MLTSRLLVTGGQGTLYLWDVVKGDVLRSVSLGEDGGGYGSGGYHSGGGGGGGRSRVGGGSGSVFIRHTSVISNSTVVCDMGSQLRVIHFPSVLEKAD